jgi:hypothetical protein
MSISNIEHKLYTTNFKHESLRLKSYLAVHATLNKNKDVPRVFIPNGYISSEKFSDLLNEILYSDINLITEQTNKCLNLLNISSKSLYDLNLQDKKELLSLIEDLIKNGWGEGSIHYEHLRIVPDSNCDILDKLKIHFDNTENHIKLISILEKRHDSSIKHQNEFNSLFSIGNRKYHPSVLAKSYQLLIEKLWRNNWAHSSNYIVNHDDAQLCSLIITEDL